MSTLIYIVAVVIFPLNFLWAFTSGAENNKKQESAEIAAVDVEQGDSTWIDGKKEEPLSERELSNALALPTKKEGTVDMKIPTAYSSLVLDVDSGSILHYDKGSERRQIASLTKLMTASLVMERINNLEEEATIGQTPLRAEGTKIGCPRSGYCISPTMRLGEKLTVASLMKAMLMNSANDAAIALAEHVSGTEQEFVKLMNEKAKELGLKDTNFCTASGLEPDGRESECYSTAYDIARIAAYSMKYETIWDFFRLPNNTRIFSTDGKYYHDILNTDLVMDQIPNCMGGKTGFTPLAGRSLLVAAADGTQKHKIVAVLLNDPYRWQNIKDMVSWTFNSYDWK